ncbi:hypothetical protein OAK91_05370 [Planctomycetaceae bacterium]|jgi:hypothetical protein|nr:hypothetical protein [bacterium]MDC0274142.1 hypothetical protein [Planctomycetaceae bacterium]
MKYYFFGLGTMMAVCVGCYIPSGGNSIEKNKYVAPPAAMMQRPGPMVDGPGPGVMPMLSHPPARSFVSKTTQLRFVEPKAMQIGWRIRDGYAESQITAPGRYNFTQGATYRLKISDVPGREGLTLYPTLQVYPAHPSTDAYLSHNSIPIALTTEDLNQIESNNFVTKVIYLPDPKNQELAIAGVETIVSTRLDPGVDPVAEADRRGTVMVVLRAGNMNLEMPGADLDMTGLDFNGNIRQVVHLDGMQGQTAPPMPIAESGVGLHGVPSPMIMGGSSMPGQPAMYPVAGMGPTPSWGMPITATPIGLPGPPHIPLGGPAGLKSHTVRNLTSVDIGKPVDHLLIDVEHDPGYRLPHPVKHIQYKEKHPNFAPGATTFPNWAVPQQGAPQY